MKNYTFYMAIIITSIIILSIAVCINLPSFKLKENEILYNRFRVEQIIHRRLIVVEDINTKAKYWMIKDFRWLISANYKEGD